MGAATAARLGVTDLTKMFIEEDTRRIMQSIRVMVNVLKTVSQPAAPEEAREPDSLPALNARARGWLQYMHARATDDDTADWTEASPTGPKLWWDNRSAPPMTSWHRFDLQESCYAVVLMAEMTPAWHECYAAVLDGLARRFTMHWAAADFLNQVQRPALCSSLPSIT